MARNKYPEVTVNRILDVATRLFLEKGYEETTIQAILDELGDLSNTIILSPRKILLKLLLIVCLRTCIKVQ